MCRLSPAYSAWGQTLHPLHPPLHRHGHTQAANNPATYSTARSAAQVMCRSSTRSHCTIPVPVRNLHWLTATCHYPPLRLSPTNNTRPSPCAAVMTHTASGRQGKETPGRPPTYRTITSLQVASTAHHTQVPGAPSFMTSRLHKHGYTASLSVRPHHANPQLELVLSKPQASRPTAIVRITSHNTIARQYGARRRVIYTLPPGAVARWVDNAGERACVGASGSPGVTVPHAARVE
eukprot:XP_001697310.1 predicted protein [Chlamydomonas reinhardtii]